MRILFVSPASKTGEAARWRWVLQADFDTRHGFTPSYFGPDAPDNWGAAYVAIEDGRLVGALRYELVPSKGCMRAGGTWVDPAQRHTGLASRLWRRALRGRRAVEVTTVSKGGKALIESLKERHPKISWIHSF